MALDPLTQVLDIVVKDPSPANNNVVLSLCMSFYLMNTATEKMLTVV